MSTPEEKQQKIERASQRKRAMLLEAKQKNTVPFWLWILILVGVTALLWTGGDKVIRQVEVKRDNSPFYQVTNREMSLFLWQNFEYMRTNYTSVAKYLPGFHTGDKVTPIVEEVDDQVVAPADVLFRFHTWKRLLSSYTFANPIPPKEFEEFLKDAEEWQPKNWPDCPTEYKEWLEETAALEMEKLHTFKVDNLQTLSTKVLPNVVRNAFLGWKNYMRQRSLIDSQKPTVSEMREFLVEYPNYSRNYWRNIYPDYLKSLRDDNIDPRSLIPEHEMTTFLKTAFFNYQQSK